ncbi:hypothetical protein CRG98_009064 [Punica granatum]|uniref:Uncharacterized protein n=1 Tax=Punica granatum TaxID=22663 RepID=A0A2I0KQ40_PUNGR|nr:hypothetical protein CRG98_009064 [Punica granatum]
MWISLSGSTLGWLKQGLRGLGIAEGRVHQYGWNTKDNYKCPHYVKKLHIKINGHRSGPQFQARTYIYNAHYRIQRCDGMMDPPFFSPRRILGPVYNLFLPSSVPMATPPPTATTAVAARSPPLLPHSFPHHMQLHLAVVTPRNLRHNLSSPLQRPYLCPDES